MKIAIVSPSPVPFTIGGIENLSWGLCEAINQLPSCQCELLKLPSRELGFWELIHNYYNFYHLDVSHFDTVICMKYPAWMIQHPNCIIYMAHCLRGLYDTYGNTKRSMEVETEQPEVRRLLEYMEDQPEPESLEPFFQMLFDLEEKESIPEELLLFPGPLIRKIIHYMDQFAFLKHTDRPVFAISETVKARWEYFPSRADVKVVYPPTTVKQGNAGEYRYIFVVSRLDRPKRIDLLLRAMHYVNADIKLYIAGTGPMEAELKKLAMGDDRIEFLGYVKDEEISEWYANSLVIPYFPYDEDYGLITIEAMLHKKPVITTTDAGGPTEFVVDGETGYITSLGEREIAARIDYLAAHPEEAKRMGEQAYDKVKDITWESTVEQLLRPETGQQKEPRKKLTVSVTFPIYPPTGGGQVRIYQLYKHFAAEYDVELVTFTRMDKPSFQERIASNLWETRIPKSVVHQLQENELEKEMQISVGDVAMFENAEKTVRYGEKLKASIESSELVILSHPYLYYEVQKYIGNRPFLYEAQDVEYLIKKQMLPDTEHRKRLLEQLQEAERLCCENSLLIMTCSDGDKEALCELYPINPDKVIVVPNGVDVEDMSFIPMEHRLENKRLMNLEENKIGLFMGSGHKPNYEACEHIFQMAEELPEVTFLIIGTACIYFQQHGEEYQIPPNVGMLGAVSEAEKKRLFSVVDFALNPMTSGSGTNLKLFDYMAAGIPVITTEFGTRGVEQKDSFLIASVEEMPRIIRSFRLEEQEERIRKARTVAEQEFSWSHIGTEALNAIKARLSD
ncbi:MAG: glycosyltransferase family 4 protein [Bacteroides sp.]|nr:glycosyltransferase family 4 protein [Bacteroides sp.]MCM1548407.1 glycosyltransferase family 4 protein [Clostridium sp.]